MELEPQREVGFLDLALDRALVGEEDVLGELLRDRRPALHHPGGAGVDGERAQRADHVDAEMAEEAPVLGREHRLDEMVRQFLERHGFVAVDAALADLDAVAVLKRHREIAARQPVLVRRLAEGGEGQGESDQKAREPERQRLAGELDREPGRPDSRSRSERVVDRLEEPSVLWPAANMVESTKASSASRARDAALNASASRRVDTNALDQAAPDTDYYFWQP